MGGCCCSWGDLLDMGRLHQETTAAGFQQRMVGKEREIARFAGTARAKLQLRYLIPA